MFYKDAIIFTLFWLLINVAFLWIKVTRIEHPNLFKKILSGILDLCIAVVSVHFIRKEVVQLSKQKFKYFK